MADPFFGGAGPERTTCIGCGECMSGCRHNAKNTLVKNYLYLAEQNGARILPLTTVTRVAPRSAGGYDVHVRFTKAKLGRRSARRVLTAEQVVFAASALGTQRLLHQMKDEGHLPGLSDTRRPPRADQLRVDRRCDRARHDDRLQRGRRDHLELPPGRAHPHRARAVRQGQQRHVADADGAHRRRGPPTAVARLATRDVGPACPRPRPLRPQALVGADRHRAGHAERRQLHHDVHQADPRHQAALPDQQAGPRRAQPDLDPGRQPGRTADGRRSWAVRRAAPSASRSTGR